jgi:lipid II:glycine glycyltransferase (peptidoglycan interpeptide bridge formation enzyme)
MSSPRIDAPGPIAPSGPDANPATGWDTRLRDAGGHLLQSWRWGTFKERHGWVPERILVETGEGWGCAQVLYRSQGPVSIGYVPRGPVLAGEPWPIWTALRDEIDRAARAHRAIMTIIESDGPLDLTGSFRDAGLVRGPSHFQPARTVRVPLLDDAALLARMHQKTRYSVRLAQRRGVTVSRCGFSEEAIDRFYDLMRDTSQRNRFGIHARAYYADFLRVFGDDAVLLFADAGNGQTAAALIAAAFGSESIYMYGASSSEHRAHGAAFLLQFEAMRWAREHGCATYDLWGIPKRDPDTIHDDDQRRIVGTRGEDLRGLYRFKTGFGGEIVSHPPTLERRHLPVLPWLARRLNVVRG